jgi:hypothetical protein
MKHKKAIFVLCLLGALSQTFAKTLIKDVAQCKLSSISVPDMDGDRLREKLCLLETEHKYQNINSWSLMLELSKSKQQIVVGDSFRRSVDDDYFESLNLNKYQHPRIKTHFKGTGLRITHPEKSSVIYYWNSKKQKLEEFWESD